MWQSSSRSVCSVILGKMSESRSVLYYSNEQNNQVNSIYCRLLTESQGHSELATYTFFLPFCQFVDSIQRNWFCFRFASSHLPTFCRWTEVPLSKCVSHWWKQMVIRFWLSEAANIDIFHVKNYNTPTFKILLNTDILVDLVSTAFRQKFEPDPRKQYFGFWVSNHLEKSHQPALDGPMCAVLTILILSIICSKQFFPFSSSLAYT